MYKNPASPRAKVKKKTWRPFTRWCYNAAKVNCVWQTSAKQGVYRHSNWWYNWRVWTDIFHFFGRRCFKDIFQFGLFKLETSVSGTEEWTQTILHWIDLNFNNCIADSANHKNVHFYKKLYQTVNILTTECVMIILNRWYWINKFWTTRKSSCLTARGVTRCVSCPWRVLSGGLDRGGGWVGYSLPLSGLGEGVNRLL